MKYEKIETTQQSEKSESIIKNKSIKWDSDHLIWAFIAFFFNIPALIIGIIYKKEKPLCSNILISCSLVSIMCLLVIVAIVGIILVIQK